MAIAITNTDNVLVVSYRNNTRLVVDIAKGQAGTLWPVSIICQQYKKDVWTIACNGETMMRAKTFKFADIKQLISLYCKRDEVAWRIASNLFAALNGEPIESNEARLAYN